MPPSPEAAGLRDALLELNAAYARAIDDDRLEDWPELFADPCLYKITTAENHTRGLEAGLVYADSRAMLRDRVAALRRANIYERQRYRHVVGLPAVRGREGDAIVVESPFVVIRIMRDGTMDVFATGRYLDRVRAGADEGLRLAERIVVCDGGRVDTLLALPL